MHYEYLCELGNALVKNPDICVTYISVKDYNYRDQIRFPLLDLYPDYSTMNLKVRKLIAHLKALATLSRELMVKRPDVFHVQGFRHASLDWPVLLIANACGIKVVLTVHNLLPHESKTSDRFVYKFMYKLADQLIAHTKHTATKLAETMGVDGTKIVIIPHGRLDFQVDLSMTKLEARKALELAENDTVLLYFGRIRHYKGVDLLVEAVKRLHNPKAKLIIAGKDNIGLGQTIDGIPSIIFNGNFIDPKDVNMYFRAADLVVLPYRKIDQSGVLLLAMAAERPVLGTKVGGIQEIIQDGMNGFLCEAGSSEALRAKLSEVLSDKRRLAEVGENAKKYADEMFGWDRIASKTVDLYRQLIR